MDEAQIGQLGSKMREAYSDIASEPTAVTEASHKRASRRLRKSPTFARRSSNTAASGNLLRQHPIASLLVAAGIGFVLARL